MCIINLWSGNYKLIIHKGGFNDTVVLKDGRQAAIVEVFSDTQFLADVGDDPSTWETIGITIDDIKEVI